MGTATLTAPEQVTDTFPINGTDFVEFYVGNAKQAAHFYRNVFGYKILAYRGPETGTRGLRGWRVSEREPGPAVVWLVRHGESMGNVADAHAQSSGSGRLKLDVRDPDVPLSDTGRAQAEALGTWLAGLPEDERPTAVLSSPFNRALTTARLATEKLGIPLRTDERLRERDFGAFDGMTGAAGG